MKNRLATLGALAAFVGATGCASAAHIPAASSVDASYKVGLGGAFADDEDGIDAKLRANARFAELDKLVSDGMVEALGMSADGHNIWLMTPDPTYFRAVLVNGILVGEIGGERCLLCAQVRAGVLPPQPGIGTDCDLAEMCARQHEETMSSCQAILDNKCVFALEPACRLLRKWAYNKCVAVAQCQLDCCNDYCSGINCANWVANESGDKCVNCEAPINPM